MKTITAPVLLIFFNRPLNLTKTFEAIKAAKPSKLYLFQDGARNEMDTPLIQECRKVVSNIDWDCEIHHKYLENNLGCGMGPKTAIDWVFENEDRAIILEDDCVASESFFPFCDELLEKYKTDQRVFLITGCNLEIETLECRDSYFFGYAGTNWGWATWKRNWKQMDYNCSWVKDEATLESMREFLIKTFPHSGQKELSLAIKTNKLCEEGINISYWDVQWQFVRYLNHQLSIIPQKNLITNIGVGSDSTHAQTIKAIDKIHSIPGKINTHFNKSNELSFPLIHPKYLLQNNYDERIYSFLYPSYLKRIYKKLISVILRFHV